MTGRLSKMITAGVATAVLVVASGCAAIPRSGQIGHIDVDGKQAGPVQATPEGPADGASADQVIRGFLAAGSGPAGNFAVARSYLTDDLAESWEPSHDVYVLKSGRSLDSVSSEVKSNSQSASVTIPIEARVDSDRKFTGNPPQHSKVMQFRMRQVNGQWRIAKAPNAIIVPPGNFYTMFQARSLYYYTSDNKVAVPDERWYLRGSQSATDITRDLLSGPSGYLRGAVHLPGSRDRLSVQQVTVDDGTARVKLGGEPPSGKKMDQLSAMVAKSLMGIGTVQQVDVTAGSYNTSLSKPDLPRAGVSVEGNPVAIREGRLVELRGDKAKNIGKRLAGGAGYPAVDYGHERYAYLAKDRTRLHAVRATPWSDEVVLSGKALVSPSYDRSGWIFTAKEKSDTLVAVRPDGSRRNLPASFLKGRTVKSINVSRDGARIAVVSERDGTSRLDLVGLVRKPDMVPSRLVADERLDLGSSLASIADVSWTGLGGLAVLAATDSNSSVLPYRLTLSGVAEGLGAVTQGRYITAGDGDRELRIVTSNGSMYSPNPPNSWDVADNLKVGDPAYPG